MQVLSFTDHFGISDDDPRVNPWGGAIATGHPLASSGVRLMLQLARQFEQRADVRYGVTAMCVGLGQGGSVIWEAELQRKEEVAVGIREEFADLANMKTTRSSPTRT